MLDHLIEFRIHNTNASLYSQLGKYELAKNNLQKVHKKFLRIHPSLKEYTEKSLTTIYDVIGFYMSYERI